MNFITLNDNFSCDSKILAVLADKRRALLFNMKFITISKGKFKNNNLKELLVKSENFS